MIFLYDFIFVLFAVAFFAFGGWSVIAPFQRHLSFPLACATLAGLIVIPCATLTFHVVLVIKFWKAAIAATLAMYLASLIALRVFGHRAFFREIKLTLALMVVAALIAVLTVTRTDVFLGEPGLLLFFGTDHLGYANMADWLRLRGGNAGTPTPDDVYSSFPAYLLSSDPRFGAIALLALISTVSGRSGVFAFDLTCAVVLTIAPLGVSSIFSRNRFVFILLSVSLFTNTWFDVGRMGYLGKITGFPASLFGVGLFTCFARLTEAEDKYPLAALGALAVTITCATLMFNYVLTVIVLGLIGIPFLALRALWMLNGPKRTTLQENLRLGATLLALMIMVVFVSGVVARPLYIGNAAMSVGWQPLLYWAAQIQVVGLSMTNMPSALLLPTTIALATIWAALGVYAFGKRLPDAVGLVFGPMALMALLCMFDEQWRFYQTIFLYGPAAACAAAIVTSHEQASRPRRLGFATLFFLLPLSLTLPRFTAMLAYFGGPLTPPLNRLSSSETDRLAAAIGSDGAVIDAGDETHLNYFLVVELGRRQIPFQLSERSWPYVMGYRPWPAPKYEKPMPYLIVRRSDANSGLPSLVMRTTQFDLLRQP